MVEPLTFALAITYGAVGASASVVLVCVLATKLLFSRSADVEVKVGKEGVAFKCNFDGEAGESNVVKDVSPNTAAALVAQPDTTNDDANDKRNPLTGTAPVQQEEEETPIQEKDIPIQEEEQTLESEAAVCDDDSYVYKNKRNPLTGTAPVQQEEETPIQEKDNPIQEEEQTLEPEAHDDEEPVTTLPERFQNVQNLHIEQLDPNVLEVEGEVFESEVFYDCFQNKSLIQDLLTDLLSGMFVSLLKSLKNELLSEEKKNWLKLLLMLMGTTHIHTMVTLHTTYG